MFRLIFFFTLSLLLSCQSSSTNKENEGGKVKQEISSTYPMLPVAEHQWLANNCDYIDYLYYELPMSMSFHEKASIVSAIAHISDQPAPMSIPCKSIGRVSYQQNGEIRLEAEMYYAKGCTYFVFLKNNKPVYGNAMTPAAINFYANVFKQANVTPK